MKSFGKILSAPQALAITVVLLLSFFVVLSSPNTFIDNPYTMQNDWSEFDKYINDAKLGGNVDCNAFIETQMTRGDNYFDEDTFTENFSDYMKMSGDRLNAMPQCLELINPIIEKACDNYAEIKLNNLVHNKIDDLRQGNFKLCREFVIEKYNSLDTDFVGPSPESPFYEFDVNGKVYILKSIDSALVDHNEELGYWTIYVVSGKYSLNLYYGDKSSLMKSLKKLKGIRDNE